jgi:hypothetical protein
MLTTDIYPFLVIDDETIDRLDWDEAPGLAADGECVRYCVELDIRADRAGRDSAIITDWNFDTEAEARAFLARLMLCPEVNR